MKHLITTWRIVQSVRKLLTIPDEQFGFRGHGLHCVEIYIILNLASYEILFISRLCRIHVAHPVTPSLVKAVDVVTKAASLIHLYIQENLDLINTPLNLSHL